MVILNKLVVVVFDTNAVSLTESVFAFVPLNTFLPWCLYDVDMMSI